MKQSAIAISLGFLICIAGQPASYAQSSLHPSPLSMFSQVDDTFNPYRVHPKSGSIISPGLHFRYHLSEKPTPSQWTYSASLGRNISAIGEEEPIYQTSFKKDIPLTGSGVVLLGASQIIRLNGKPLVAEQISALNPTNISSFDRGATRQYSTSARHLSDGFVLTSTAVPFLYLAGAETRRDFGRIIVMQLETGLLNLGMVSLTKVIASRIRPFAYNATVPAADKLTVDARESFYSGHTSTAAAMSFFMATTFSQYYPHSRLKPLVWTYAIGWPAVTGYLRYQAGAHFPTDIITGYLIGAATGIVIPKLHQKLRARKNSVGARY